VGGDTDPLADELCRVIGKEGKPLGSVDNSRKDSDALDMYVVNALVNSIWVLAILSGGCGGGSDSPDPPAAGVIRLAQGHHGSYDGIDVGVMQVHLRERPQRALVSVVESGKAGSEARHVDLAVGEGTDVGGRRFVLVGAGKGDKKTYAVRLELIHPTSPATTPDPTPPASTPPYG
jgi:hypothetical protein